MTWLGLEKLVFMLVVGLGTEIGFVMVVFVSVF